MNIYDSATRDGEEVVTLLGTSLKDGLTSNERKKRLIEHGMNEVRAKKITWYDILFRQFQSPFVYLLLSAALFSFFLGRHFDAGMIAFFVFVNTALGFYQEFKSEKTLRILKKYYVSHERIVENGEIVTVPLSNVVPGDIVLLGPGDVVPADVRILESQKFIVDESVLTGESVGVGKTSEKLIGDISEPQDGRNIIFSGTSIASGEARGVVVATGVKTVFGKIAKLTAETSRTSILEKELSKLSSFIMKLVLVTVVFIIVVNLFLKGPNADIVTIVIFAIALAVSVIPEALPVVTTFSLSRGAARLAKNKAVVKRLSAIEDLGGTEILCTDKTGTLTENKLTVMGVFPDASQNETLFTAMLGSPFLHNKKERAKNSFDAALWEKLNDDEKEKVAKYETLFEFPFDPIRRQNTAIVKYEDDHEVLYIARGAPEPVLERCTGISPHFSQKLSQWMSEEGLQGRRVFAVAAKKMRKRSEYDSMEEEGHLNLVGIISFEDPLKPSTKNAIAKARALGVGIKILTGDGPEVAGAVGFKIGLAETPQSVITGKDFENLPDDEKEATLEKYNVFARVSPKQKYDIIRILQEKKNVGFLGEGINDAPALKIANVAIVVQGASDIAREAADIVLLQKSLHAIILSIEEGRKVFANTVKYIKATLASNFGNFYAVAVASFIVDFLPLLPLQILLVNLLSDFPMIAVSTDNVDKEELREPKSYNIREITIFAFVLGIVSTIFDFIYFSLFFRMGPESLQTAWFMGSIITELLFLFSIRTKNFFLSKNWPSSPLVLLSAFAFFLTLLFPYTYIGKSIFSFTPPPPEHIALILGVAAVYLVVTESVKLLYYRHKKETASV